MGDTPKQESPGLAHRIGVTTDGVYQGLIKMGSGVGIAVDAINKGLQVVGVPVSEKPVGGSTWIKEKLTGAYDGYNKVAGVTVPKPVDKTDVVLHAVGDIVGQTAIPIAAAVSKPAAAVTGLKEVAGAVKNAGSYSSAGNSTLSDAATYARTATVAAGTAGVAGNAAKEASAAARAEFKTAAAPAAAQPAPAMAVTRQEPAAAASTTVTAAVPAKPAAVAVSGGGGSMADKYASLIGENLTSITVPTQVAAAPPNACPAPAQAVTARPTGMG